MHRNEAISFLKELIGTCETLNPDAIALEDSSRSCRVIIKGIFDGITTDYVQVLASKHQLDVEEKAGKLVVFDRMHISHI